MTIDKNNEGAWRICENINGYLETQVYYFYTKKDAIKKFKEYKKNLINQQKGTMQKYKVKLTFIEEVEATNEQDAIIIAYDGVVASDYNDVEVDEIKND